MLRRRAAIRADEGYKSLSSRRSMVLDLLNSCQVERGAKMLCNVKTIAHNRSNYTRVRICGDDKPVDVRAGRVSYEYDEHAVVNGPQVQRMPLVRDGPGNRSSPQAPERHLNTIRARRSRARPPPVVQPRKGLRLRLVQGAVEQCALAA